MDLPGIVLAGTSDTQNLKLTLGLILKEAVNFGDGSVEGHDSEAMISSVEDQVLAHDRQANETEITTGFGLRRADLEASQSRTKVSILFVNLGIFSRKRQAGYRRILELAEDREPGWKKSSASGNKQEGGLTLDQTSWWWWE